jgi:hypothetical protein
MKVGATLSPTFASSGARRHAGRGRVAKPQSKQLYNSSGVISTSWVAGQAIRMFSSVSGTSPEQPSQGS